MKNKILCGIMSFIFSFQICYPCLYAATNEVMENITSDEKVVENSQIAEEKIEEVKEQVSDEMIQEEVKEKIETDEKVVENSQIAEEKIEEIFENQEEYRTYKGDICIDIPQNNTEIIKQNTTKMRVSGWAVSEDEKARVQLKVDGNIENSELVRIKRPDVDRIISSDYGGTEITPNSGYVFDMDVSKLSIRNT